jgi:DNA-binding transcriptional MerR regulator
MADEVVLPEGQEHFKLSEVCKLADVQPYMLRFWGTEFTQLAATKNGTTGQRKYSRAQVETILEIRRLLFDEGLTIAGARKRINAAELEKPARGSRKGGKGKSEEKKAATTGPEVDKTGPDRVKPLVAALRDIRGEVTQMIAELKAK